MILFVQTFGPGLLVSVSTWCTIVNGYSWPRGSQDDCQNNHISSRPVYSHIQGGVHCSLDLLQCTDGTAL